MLSKRIEIISSALGGLAEDTFNDPQQRNEKYILSCLDFTSKQEPHLPTGSSRVILSAPSLSRQEPPKIPRKSHHY